MTDDQPTHSGVSKHSDSKPAAFNDLQNNQLILPPGEKMWSSGRNCFRLNTQNLKLLLY